MLSDIGRLQLRKSAVLRPRVARSSVCRDKGRNIFTSVGLSGSELFRSPHRKRGKGKAGGGGQTGPTSDGVLRVVTDLPDVPAEVVAFLYQYRWTIEVFFRFLKQVLGCRHLLSARREGVEIQVYAAVICCLLLNQLTGRKPTKWMVTLMAFYLQGLATDADVLKELNRRDNTGVRLRAKDELWKKLGY